MNRPFVILIVAAACLLIPGSAQLAPLGSGFTYQGEIQENGNPVNRTVHLQFSLWDAEVDGAQIGASQPKEKGIHYRPETEVSSAPDSSGG